MCSLIVFSGIQILRYILGIANKKLKFLKVKQNYRVATKFEIVDKPGF